MLLNRVNRKCQLNNRNISRRTFIRNASLAVAGTAALNGCTTNKLTERTNSAEITTRDPNSFALIADTHIHSAPDYVVNNQCGSFNMANNLTEVIGQITKVQPPGVLFSRCRFHPASGSKRHLHRTAIGDTQRALSSADPPSSGTLYRINAKKAELHSNRRPRVHQAPAPAGRQSFLSPYHRPA